MSVYAGDISFQTHIVESKFGKSPFYNNFVGFSFSGLYDNVGIEKIRCSEFTPKVKKWSKKYGKSFGDKA